jgi:hypothetical protein
MPIRVIPIRVAHFRVLGGTWDGSCPSRRQPAPGPPGAGAAGPVRTWFQRPLRCGAVAASQQLFGGYGHGSDGRDRLSQGSRGGRDSGLSDRLGGFTAAARLTAVDGRYGR